MSNFLSFGALQKTINVLQIDFTTECFYVEFYFAKVAILFCKTCKSILQNTVIEINVRHVPKHCNMSLVFDY